MQNKIYELRISNYLVIDSNWDKQLKTRNVRLLSGREEMHRGSYPGDTQAWNVGNKVAATTPVVDIA
ncbi:hypothetical protein LC653_15325 [Nostoc sp. CHAB 5784]|uniref:hypothetical protein n=1 Tax=Nostoc mirabile TaxID=2907820 RepID=UPI001E4379EE|nr:hypothetical protein [Nostoc mirabile]MCC5665250.1 hypothetical protein [Nostoc mirabile CHAB5784]